LEDSDNFQKVGAAKVLAMAAATIKELEVCNRPKRQA
tara:strand:+ start:33 stop:143 length:111 start_codon:yes stop_codon:yes gene_type:complete